MISKRCCAVYFAHLGIVLASVLSMLCMMLVLDGSWNGYIDRFVKDPFGEITRLLVMVAVVWAITLLPVRMSFINKPDNGKGYDVD